jgi:hypothetical protein
MRANSSSSCFNSPNYSFKGNPSVCYFQPSIRRRVPLTQALGQMRATLALIIIGLSTMGCSRHWQVSRTEESRFLSSPAGYDRPRVGWTVHGGLLSVSVTTMMSPSDWVPKKSLRIIKSKETITLCYSVVPREKHTTRLPPVPTRYLFWTDAVRRSDTRTILLSNSCGKTT